MFCPSCGAKSEGDDRFCQRCGKPLPNGPELGVSEGGSEPASVATPSPSRPAWGETSMGLPSWTGSYEPAPSASMHQGAPPAYGSPLSQTNQWTNSASTPGMPLASFGAPLAGWWQRVGAMLLDILILGIPLGILDVILNAAFGTARTVVTLTGTTTTHSLQGGARVAVFIGFTVIGALYFSVFNGGRDGQTPGNRAPGISVRDANTGEPIGLKRGFLRWFIRAILYTAFLIPGLLNDLFPLWDRRHQSLADKVAGSVVIRLK